MVLWVNFLIRWNIQMDMKLIAMENFFWSCRLLIIKLFCFCCILEANKMIQMLGLTAALSTVSLKMTVTKNVDCVTNINFCQHFLNGDFWDLHEHMLEEKIYEKQNLVQEKHIRKLYSKGIRGLFTRRYNFESFLRAQFRGLSVRIWNCPIVCGFLIKTFALGNLSKQVSTILE